MAGLRRRTGPLSALKWFAILVLVVDIVYVLWPYPNGPQGIGALQSAVDKETALIGELTDDASAQVIRHLGAWVYRAAFVWTELDELKLMHRAAASAPMSGANEFMRGFERQLAVPGDCGLGVAFFSLRLGVLVLAMPLFLITAIGAVVDGVVPWYWRRAGTGPRREFGFIYHRAKCALGWAVRVLRIRYLLSPGSSIPASSFHPSCSSSALGLN